MAKKRLYLVYFSPSGSTEKIVKMVANEIANLDEFEVEKINLLYSANRKKKYHFTKDDLVVFGCASAGKLFTLSEEMFECLQAKETPFIGLITYGNAYYGIAIKEMFERANKSGFSVVSLGAFISRRSIDMSLAHDRPDASDLEIIKNFAKKSYEKFLSGDFALHDELKTGWGDWELGKQVIAYRQEHPEVLYTLPPEYKSKEISDACKKCGTCVKNCPTDAIDIENKIFDLDKCIACWACINR
ncbi:MULTISPECIES: 4Fe-4S binding protein [unclassified Campylobacter]|uniref:4Fe-4S binding protein n=1 Tax=unclassified Campylobacter TaxID=2593542 RepID=UPI003D357F03